MNNYYWFARGSGGGDEIGGDSRFFQFSRLQKLISSSLEWKVNGKFYLG